MKRLLLVILLIIAGTIGGMSLRAQSGGSVYKIVGVGPFETNDDVAKKLNAEAAAGWELVSILPMVSNNIGILGERNPDRILTSARLIMRRDSK
jgi:hypothetical protein